jgi:hypothetical protein
MTVSGATTGEPAAATEVGHDSMRLLERGLAVALFVCVILLGFMH